MVQPCTLYKYIRFNVLKFQSFQFFSLLNFILILIEIFFLNSLACIRLIGYISYECFINIVNVKQKILFFFY